MAEFILKDRYGKEKTFDHETIYVQGAAGELLPFTFGTGSSAELCYVTFMSYDGSVEYGKKAVALGDNCADPIDRDLFDTPERPMTQQYSYTFDGWATVPNGAADSNWNKSITRDKTVYAAYKSTVRTYTIKFYDYNDALGTMTLLNQQTLPYGATPNYTPVKDGYTFDGWRPSISVVTGDQTYTATWIEQLSFAGSTWAKIAEISESGKASEQFAIGDSKVITVGGTDITLRIIGFDHDTLADGSGKAGITIFAEKTLDTTMSVANWATVASNMRTKIKTQLPSDLQAVIKPVLKPCDDPTLLNQEITPTDVQFELFPLSFEEIGVKVHGGYNNTKDTWTSMFATLGTTYAYYAGKYNTTYKGPLVAPFISDGDIFQSWFRQYYRASPVKGLIQDSNLQSTNCRWGAAADITSSHKVMFAFCI